MLCFRKKLIQIILYFIVLPVCVVLWCAAGADAHYLGGFPGESARLLRRIRLKAPRAALVPAVISDVQFALQARFPGCKGESYGSIASGLGIKDSDVDISITFEQDEPAANMTSSELVLEAEKVIMQFMHDNFFSFHFFMHSQLFEVVKVVPIARVPILSIKHLPSGFNADISFNNYNAVLNSKLVHYLVRLDQRARDLAQILKYWARIHELSGHTMLPSYGVVTMAIFFLQQKQILPPIASLQTNADIFMVNHWNMGFTEEQYENNNSESLCELLGGFFKYYYEFDFEKFVVSPHVGYPIEIRRFEDWRTVPEELYMYRANVALNITSPLRLQPPVIQDSFVLNDNLAHRVTDPARRALVDQAIRYAAGEYKEGCPGFLKAILIEA